MKFNKLRIDHSGHVGIIRLDDPNTMNAVTCETVDEINEALSQLLESSRAVVLTGAGASFCSGANLKEGINSTDEHGRLDAGGMLETHLNPLMTRLRDLPVPWISAVRGAVAGVGCSFALAADMIIASETAYFLQAFCRIGLVPDGGSTFLLTQAIGRPRAMEMMLLGEKISAVKALEWGLINRVVSDDQLDTAALALATQLAAGPRSLALIRRLGWIATAGVWENSLKEERRLQREAGLSDDFKEGVAAFTGKRKAQFTGR